MRLVKFAVNNPYWIVVFILIVGLLGGVCAVLLPKDILPTFKASAVQVVTFYPGMPAEVMEKDISTRLERWTGQSNGIAKQESKSMIGVSIVKDFFRPDVDPNTAMSQVTSFAMSDLFYLPPGTIPPMVMPFDPTASVPLALITVQNPDMNETKLYDVAYFDLRNLLQGISGVIAPAVYGGTLRRILAYVDPARLARRSLSSLDIVQSLRESNILIPTGDAKLGDKDVQIVTDALVPEVGQMNEFPIRAHEGVEIKMKDVADVQDSHQIQTNVVRINGKRQVYIPIYRQPGANTIEVVDGIRKALKLILERLPKGMKLDVAADQSIFVRRAIDGLSHEVALGGLLAAIMVLLFLGSLRSAVAVFIAIPTSILACLLGLYMTGDTINAMTLGGLALAVGRLIDDSIVVLENITRHMEQGRTSKEAALEATGEVAMPVLAATVTTIIVFLPVFFLTGIGKFLFAPLAKAVAFSIGASYFVAMTFIPIYCMKFLKPRTGTSTKAAMPSRYEQFLERYKIFLRRSLVRRRLIIAAAVAAFAASLLLYPRIGKELFPRADVGHLTLHVSMPTGTRIEVSEQTAAEIERRLGEVIESSALKVVITNIGVLNDWPAAYTPNSGPGDMFFEIELNDERKQSTREYADALRTFFKKNYPQLEISVETGGLLTAALNQGLPAPINVQVEGNKLDISRGIAQKLVERMKAIPGAVDARIQERLDYPQIEIKLDRSKIAKLGLTVEEVVKNLVAALNSSINFAPSFWIDPKNGNHYFLGAQYPEQLIQSLDTLKNIAITGKQQQLVVKLREIASFEEKTAPSEIRHLNIKRVVNIFADVSGRDVGSVAQQVERLLPKADELPEGYRVYLRGEVSSMKEAFANLGFGLLLAVLLVHLVLSGQFESFLDPLLILCAVPLGLMGVLAVLWATGTALNIQSLTGIIFMVGIAVSNSILLVEFANRGLASGKSPDDAIVEAAVVRLRPILMTSSATVLGLLPMAIGLGRGSEANVPLARAVLGGIFVSTILVLVVVPMLYDDLQRLKASLSGKRLTVILLPFALLALAAHAQAAPQPVSTISNDRGDARLPASTAQTLTLEEVMERALRDNPLVKIARARVQEADTLVTTTWSSAFPRLTASAMDSDGLGGSSQALGISGLVNSPYRKGPAAGVDLAWNLYDFGRTSYRGEAAKRRKEAAEAELQRTLLEVRLRTAEAYLRCARAGSLISALTDQEKDQDAFAKEVERYVEAGLRSPVELSLVRGTIEGIRAKNEEIYAGKATTIEELRELMAAAPNFTFDCSSDAMVLVKLTFVDGALDRALAQRPELNAARQELAAADADHKAAERENWPILSAVGSGGVLDKTSLVEKKEWSAGVGVRLPLFDGFRLTAAEKRAELARQASGLRLAAETGAVTRQALSAGAWAMGFQEKRKHLEQELELVGSAYHLARRRYHEKTGTFTDLRDAQAMFFQVWEQAITARYEERFAFERLKIVAGDPVGSR